MIKSRADLLFYLEEDRKALSIQLSLKRRFKQIFFPYEIWQFEKRLRYLEYYANTKGVNPVRWGGYFLY